MNTQFRTEEDEPGSPRVSFSRSIRAWISLIVCYALLQVLPSCSHMTGKELTSVPPIRAGGDSKAPATFSPSARAIGLDRDIKANHSRGLGLLRHAGLEEFLNARFAEVKAATGIKELPGQVFLVASDALGAYITPDGNVYIYLGLIDKIASEDELIGLLAHEVAHIVHRHHESDTWFEYFQASQNSFLLINRAMHTDTGSGASGGKIAINSPVRHEKSLEFLRFVGDSIAYTAWSREQESVADRFAVDLIAKTGYSYEDGLKKVLEDVHSWAEAEQKQRQQRNQEKEEYVLNRFCKTSTPGPNKKFFEALKLEYKKCQDKLDRAKADKSTKGLFPTFRPEDGFLGYLASTHESAEIRLTALAVYIEKSYPTYSVIARKERWDTLNRRYSLRNWINTNLALVHIATGAFSPEDLQTAKLQMFPVGARATRSPLASYAMYSHLIALGGRSSEGEAMLSTGMADSSLPYWPLVREQASLIASRGGRKEAAELLDRAFVQLAEPPNLLPELVGAHNRAGNFARLSELTAKCFFSEPRYRSACMDSLK